MKREIFYQNEYKLSDGEAKIVKYIEENTEEFVSLTISKLAKRIFISPGSISKLCYKMSFKSFKLMQQWVLLQMKKYDEGTVIDNPRSTMDIVNNTKLSYERAIDRTVADISDEKIKKAIHIIKKSKIVFTYGIGSSGLASRELADGLSTISLTAINSISIHDIFLKINDDIKETCSIVVFSKSFSSRELIALREITIEKKINLIIVTANSSMNEHDNETIILIRTYEQKNRVMAMSSKISQLLISDIIINKMKKQIKNSTFKIFDKKWRTYK